MGDGCVTDRYLRYCNKNNELLSNFKRDLKTTFGQLHFIEGQVNSGTKFIQVQNKELINKLKSMVSDFRSGSLIMPSFVKTKALKKEFIRAFFDDEGSVGFRIFRKTGEIKRDIHTNSKSRKLLDEMKIVLEKDFKIKCNRLGKDTKKRQDRLFITWCLRITGRENLNKFKEEIGFTHPDKKRKFNLMLCSYNHSMRES